MKDLEKSNEEFSMCLACLGSTSLYDGISDTCEECKYCKGTGEATEAENECFLSTTIINN